MPYLEIPVPAAEADVKQALALAPLPVPADVEKLLAEHQGQAPNPEGVSLNNGGSTPFGPVLLVSATQPGTSNHTYSVTYAIDQLNEWLPASKNGPAFFPFASNTASGWFCVDQRNPDQPIVFIDVGYGPTEKEAITPVAKSVTELLKNLHN